MSGFSIPAFNMWSTGFDMSWELDVFGRVRRSLEAADADIQAAVEGRNALEVTLYGEVAATYITLRTLEQRIAAAEENVRIQKETLRVEQDRFEVEVISDLDSGGPRRTCIARRRPFRCCTANGSGW